MGTDRFRIVAIDDDKDILELIHLTLDSEFDVITLNDPSDAQETLDYIQPDLALIDVMMPKITGYHIVEDIKKDPRLHHTQIVFLSAKNSPRDVKYGYKLGANYYLTKPFQPERLRRTIDLVFAEAGVGRPHSKTWSMRDVQLRVQLKVPATYGGDDTYRIPGKADDHSSGHIRFRRPLALHEQAAEDKKWRG